ncbi:S26 family signal peptidase [Embleya hyalina]|uniref:signal peptidase I n=1 Tax=Embleya hyalina TaxID=516124 RepID=A0A401YJH3_9ACTN|nr:S26 family signal peptidase [Embleya hyalina]GCD94753.1 S26 family signal peptidase [Embleya hyalina]
MSARVHGRTGLVAATAVGAPAVAALLWVRRRYLVATVEGPSMEPTLAPGDRLLVRRGARVRAGQVVVVLVPNPATLPGLPPELRESTPEELAALPMRPEWAPRPAGRLMIKRAVAVGGDRVPRERFPVLRDVAEERVPDGALVVLGDNAASSWDSRAYGFVYRHQVVGVAVRRIVPPTGATRTSREGLAWTAPAYEDGAARESHTVDGAWRGIEPRWFDAYRG